MGRPRYRATFGESLDRHGIAEQRDHIRNPCVSTALPDRTWWLRHEKEKVT